jgi:CheY-like chemotaxis protein
LSICLSILREHGGTIDAQPAASSASALDSPAASSASALDSPAPEQGSLFIVTLPEARMAALRAEAPAAPLPFPELRERSILVVDDEPGILDLIRMTLQNRGMSVECARSSEEGLQALPSRTFDFVLCDMKMPKASGKDFYDRALAQFGALPPFILMAGDPTDPVTVEFARAADVTLLPKPFTIADLLRVLGGSRERQKRAS